MKIWVSIGERSPDSAKFDLFSCNITVVPFFTLALFYIFFCPSVAIKMSLLSSCFIGKVIFTFLFSQNIYDDVCMFVLKCF